MKSGKKPQELKNCAKCLHCKQSRHSRGNFVLAFCGMNKERVERELAYWNEKPVCKKFLDAGGK